MVGLVLSFSPYAFALSGSPYPTVENAVTESDEGEDMQLLDQSRAALHELLKNTTPDMGPSQMDRKPAVLGPPTDVVSEDGIPVPSIPAIQDEITENQP